MGFAQRDPAGKSAMYVASEVAGRAKSWRARFNRNSKSDVTVESDINSDAATAGASSNNTAFPKVLYNDGGEDDSKKEPEIGSI